MQRGTLARDAIRAAVMRAAARARRAHAPTGAPGLALALALALALGAPAADGAARRKRRGWVSEEPAVAVRAPPPAPPVWPERLSMAFDIDRPGRRHAQTATLYYDWPGRRNLLLIDAPGEHTLHDLELGNHSSYFFTPATRACKTFRVPVGVLSPDWLAGADYHGRTTVGSEEADVWTKADFIVYYAAASSGVPLRWDFLDGSGMNQTVHAGSYVPGERPPSEALWEPPAYCPPTPPAPQDGLPPPAASAREREAGASAVRNAADVRGGFPPLRAASLAAATLADTAARQRQASS